MEGASPAGPLEREAWRFYGCLFGHGDGPGISFFVALNFLENNPHSYPLFEEAPPNQYKVGPDPIAINGYKWCEITSISKVLTTPVITTPSKPMYFFKAIQKRFSYISLQTFMGQSPRVFPTNKGPKKTPPFLHASTRFAACWAETDSERRKRWYVVSTLEPPKGPKINGTETRLNHTKNRPPFIRLQIRDFFQKMMSLGIIRIQAFTSSLCSYKFNLIRSHQRRGGVKKNIMSVCPQSPWKTINSTMPFLKKTPLILVRIHTMELGTILLVIGLTYKCSWKCWW